MTESSAMDWQSLPGFPAYEVSECGDLRRVKTGTRIKGHINSDGYPEYTLRDADGRKRHVTAHRLVIEAFIGSAPALGMEVAHNDGSRLNAHWKNLRWATRQSNSDDRVRHGTTVRGECNPRAKITAQEVQVIRREYRKIKRPGSGRRVAELDEMYGLHRSTIIRIAKGQYWKHLPMGEV